MDDCRICLQTLAGTNDELQKENDMDAMIRGWRNELQDATLRLLAYCRKNEWSGYEPYDALNSPLLRIPLLDSRIPRLALTQALKRSPVNLRSLLSIRKTQNPKALALFLSTFVKLSRLGEASAEGDIRLMIERLIALRSDRADYWCWGYSFPWQTRFGLVPRWYPNLVCTSFAASALLDAYELDQDVEWLEMAASAGDYIVNELYFTTDDRVAGFGYPFPHVRNQVHNANFLAAALLSRIYKHTGEKRYLEPAMKAARYAASQQRSDGGWDYGEHPTQRWIDNFHTGFNLSALDTIRRYLETAEFDTQTKRGLEFYRAYFFREDGAVRYFHDRTYPIDAHCVAQSIITLLELKYINPDNVPLAFSVWRWTMDHMWDKQGGFFYYRVQPFFTIRTSYMRWTQAWMLLALTMLLTEFHDASPKGRTSQPAVARA